MEAQKKPGTSKDDESGITYIDAWLFCNGHNIEIAPHLELTSWGDRGTGVRAAKWIPKGRKLMHVPTESLLTTAKIPDGFVGVKARKKVPVHALLAAYLTFGLSTDDTEKYQAWMRKWPRLKEFQAGMPMLWPEQCFTQHCIDHEEIRATRDGAGSFQILPPAVTGSWLVPSTTEESCPGGSTSRADLQRQKLESHITALIKVLPQHTDALQDQTKPDYWRFTHNWCCVNTRCFYYVAPGHKAPADPNEAMAMCPGMDMFNHTDRRGCKTKYDRTGYWVIADRDYETGEEVLLSYGAHSNDVLWAEYGFILDQNENDAVRIDKLVLQGLSPKHKELLSEYGYAGEYWLRNDSVCWRTEVVAWLTVLAEHEWIKMVQEGWDPTDSEQGSPQVKRKLGGVSMMVHRERRAKKQKQQIVEWLVKAREQTENSLRSLTSLSLNQVSVVLADDAAELRASGSEAGLKFRSKKAAERSHMCLRRWCQIWEMLQKAFQMIEKEVEGTFITMAPGRTKADLNRTLTEMLRTTNEV